MKRIDLRIYIDDEVQNVPMTQVQLLAKELCRLVTEGCNMACTENARDGLITVRYNIDPDASHLDLYI